MNLINKHHELKRLYADKYNFSLFLKHLEDEELLESIESILTSRSEFINIFFHAYKNVDSDEIIFDSLFDLPYYLIEKISEKLNIIFERALNGLYIDLSNQVINKIISFTSRDRGLSNNYIQSILLDKNVDSSIKIRLLFILHTRKQEIIINDFLSNNKLEHEPHIFPFIIKVTLSNDAEKIISLLNEFKSLNPNCPSPSTLIWYQSIIFDLVLFAKGKGNIEIIRVLNEIKISWFKSIFHEIILKEEFFQFYQFSLSGGIIPNKIEKDLEINAAMDFINEVNSKYDEISLTDDIALKLGEKVFKYPKLLIYIEPEIRNRILLYSFESRENDYSYILENISQINSPEKVLQGINSRLY